MKKKNKATKAAAVQHIAEAANAMAEAVLEVTEADHGPEDDQPEDTEEANTSEPAAAPAEAKSDKPVLTRITPAHAKLMIGAAQKEWDEHKATISAEIGAKVNKASVIRAVFQESWFEEKTGLKLIELPYNVDQIQKLMATYIKL